MWIFRIDSSGQHRLAMISLCQLHAVRFCTEEKELRIKEDYAFSKPFVFLRVCVGLQQPRKQLDRGAGQGAACWHVKHMS